MDLAGHPTKPRRRDYEKILSTLETRWKRRPADRAKIMQDIVDALWDVFSNKAVSWCGFYIVTSDGQPSVLGPHQDKAAVFGGSQDTVAHAIAQRKTQIVSEARTGDNPAAQPEIAVPVISPVGEIFAVLDVYSANGAVFGEEDRRWLERLVRFLEQTTE